MYEIAKEFDFCYSHRVYTQDLDKELSCNMKCKCRHQHGHQGKIIVYLQSEEVDDCGMVIDFNELQWFKKWIDEVLDHKNILSIQDPMLPIFYPLFSDLYEPDFNFNEVFVKNNGDYWIINSSWFDEMSDTEIEIYQGLVLVPFVPTSENLSKWLWQIVDSRIGHLCNVSRVQFFETPKSQSNYYANGI